MSALKPPIEKFEQEPEELVLPNNLGNEWHDANDEAGAAGDVLTSQGPGKEPLWLPGGGGTGGGGGPIDPADLPITSSTQLGALIVGAGLKADAAGLTLMDIASLPPLP
jgi:hypothetical protein